VCDIKTKCTSAASGGVSTPSDSFVRTGNLGSNVFDRGSHVSIGVSHECELDEWITAVTTADDFSATPAASLAAQPPASDCQFSIETHPNLRCTDDGRYAQIQCTLGNVTSFYVTSTVLSGTLIYPPRQ
jgi:hypothetical protein